MCSHPVIFREGDSEDKVKASKGDSSGSMLTEETMVFGSGKLGVRTLTAFTSETDHPSPRFYFPSRPRPFRTKCMAIEREA